MNGARVVLGWICTPVFLLLLVLTLIVWQPLIAFSKPINPGLHKKIIDLGNFVLVSLLRVVGGSLAVSWPADAPARGPVIIVSNHQSFFDIPIFIWIFRRYYAKFVAKESLGSWLPSISFVLRTGGSALINRRNAKQAVREISRLGRLISEHGYAACIFPEGTRARDGKLKPFRPLGLKTLLESAPGAPVLPVAIDGSWELMRHGLLPVPFGVTVRVRILPPIARTGLSDDTILARCEELLKEALPASRLGGKA